MWTAIGFALQNLYHTDPQNNTSKSLVFHLLPVPDSHFHPLFCCDFPSFPHSSNSSLSKGNSCSHLHTDLSPFYLPFSLLYTHFNFSPYIYRFFATSSLASNTSFYATFTTSFHPTLFGLFLLLSLRHKPFLLFNHCSFHLLQHLFTIYAFILFYCFIHKSSSISSNVLGFPQFRTSSSTSPIYHTFPLNPCTRQPNVKQYKLMI